MNKQYIRLSVVIPMYQSEQHITECLQSVISQGTDGIEILCIDDGSTDRTCSIVENLRRQDKCIRLIQCRHGGVSRTRNKGIQEAQGRYLLFLDADDMLCAGKLIRVLKRAEKQDADIVVFAGKTNDPLTTPYWIREALSPRNRIYHQFQPEILLERGARPSACNKLYKRQMLLDNMIRFDEELALAEDHVMQFLVFPVAKKVIFTDCRLYFYRIHQENTAMGKASKDQSARVYAHCRAMEKIYDEWKERGFWNNGEFRELYGRCFFDFLFGELFTLPREEHMNFATRIYRDITERFGKKLTGLEEFAKEMEILALFDRGQQDEAEKELELLQNLSAGEWIYRKLTAPVRYWRKAGFRSAMLHYTGKLLGKREY